ETLAVVAERTPHEDRPGDTVTELRRWRTGEFTEEKPVRLAAPGVVRASPDGKTLYVARHNQVEIRDVTTGKVTGGTGEHPAAVTAIAVSPDGTKLATGLAGDPAIRLYDLTTMTHLATFTGHDGGTTGLAFSPDGTTLASTGADTHVVIWPLDPDRARSQVCHDLAAGGREHLTDLGCPA
ncbi:MAG: WD40 repeat domain-containing protein, partial [Actinomycetes bacterium]